MFKDLQFISVRPIQEEIQKRIRGCATVLDVIKHANNAKFLVEFDIVNMFHNIPHHELKVCILVFFSMMMEHRKSSVSVKSKGMKFSCSWGDSSEPYAYIFPWKALLLFIVWTVFYDNIIDIPGTHNTVQQTNGTPIGGLMSMCVAEIYLFVRETIPSIRSNGGSLQKYTMHAKVQKYILTECPMWAKKILKDSLVVSPQKTNIPMGVRWMNRFRDNVICGMDQNDDTILNAILSFLQDTYHVSFTNETCGTNISSLGLHINITHDETLLYVPRRKIYPNNIYNKGHCHIEYMRAYSTYIGE